MAVSIWRDHIREMKHVGNRQIPGARSGQHLEGQSLRTAHFIAVEWLSFSQAHYSVAFPQPV
jgi:hypothetical protein